MMIKAFLSLFLSCASMPLFAFPCVFTLAKDSCWTNYDVKVNVLDSVSNKILLTIEVPKGQSWARGNFDCHTAQSLMYQATFEPVFWQSEVGKSYNALRYWFLPGSIAQGVTAWEIPVCFPADFSSVPFPPDASGDCKCDFNSIPAVKPQPASPQPANSTTPASPQPGGS